MLQTAIQIKIRFNDSEQDLEDRDAEAQSLMRQLRDLDEVESVDRVLDPNPPEGNKAIGAMLTGLLTAQVNPANAKTLFSFLSDRLGGKLIELEVEANGRKLKVLAHSREELQAAIRMAEEFTAVQ